MALEAQNNPFPSVLMVEAADETDPTPDALPAAGQQRLIVGPDHLLYLLDDTGTATVVGGGGFSDPMTTRGDILIRNASNVTARLGRGTASQVLTSDGTDIAWATPAGGGGGALVLLEQHAASASANLAFTAWCSTTYDDYWFEILNLVPATNNVDFYVQFGVSGSYDTGSNYSNSGFATSTIGNASYGSVTTSMKLRTVAEIDSNSSGGITGDMKFWYPRSTGTFRRARLQCSYLNGDPIEARCTTEYVGNSGNVIDSVAFFMSSGNITSGTIRCYGVAK